MTATPRFSVVIPTHNRCDLVRQALASVVAQEYADCEVIVVDDGSSEDLSSVAAEYRGRVMFLRQDNAGPGAARNRGARAARGEYIAFLDSDDLWFPWTLAVYDNVIATHHGPAFVAGKPFCFDDPCQLDGLSRGWIQSQRFDDYLTSGDDWRWFSVSSFVIRRDVLLRAGGFTETRMNGEDADLALRLGDAPGFVQVTAPCTFAYRRHADSLMSDSPATRRGILNLLECEEAGRYPGGPARRRDRRRILTRHIRPFILECLACGDLELARALYRRTLTWNLILHRWRFLLAVPLLSGKHRLRAMFPPSFLRPRPLDQPSTINHQP